MFSNIEPGYIIVVIISLIIGVVLHEFMHGYVAHRLGDSTALDEGRLSLNPLKHVDLFMTILLPTLLLLLQLPPIFIAKPVPFDPHSVRHGEYGVALVGLAGPLTNLALAVLTAIVIRTTAIDLASSLGYILSLFMAINIGLFVFNLIPFPPLDGSRVLYAFAPEPVQRVMQQIEGAGFGVTILVLLLLIPFIGPIVSNISNTIFVFLLQ